MNNRDIYLLFKRPDSILGFFLAIFTPLGCEQYKIFCSKTNTLYGFCKETKKLISNNKVKRSEIYNDYVVFLISRGTTKKDEKKLNSLIGRDYKLFKFDCSIFKNYK
jgi:hypothetical protein